MKYLFGDSDIAAQRLKALHEIFKESTEVLLRSAVVRPPRLALDLGCGPGYTTHLLADLLKCNHVLGIDNSEHFINLAHETENEYVSFKLHDVTTVPFPSGPTDLIFCRYLLTHLKEPQIVIDQWATQLEPGGLLLMEETDFMNTDHPVFGTYIDIVKAMLDSQSNKLFVGPDLDALHDTKKLKKRESRVYRLPVQNHRAATMFYLNLQSWKNQPFITENYSVDLITRLETNLCSLKELTDGKKGIEWGLRQIVFERTY